MPVCNWRHSMSVFPVPWLSESFTERPLRALSKTAAVRNAQEFVSGKMPSAIAAITPLRRTAAFLGEPSEQGKTVCSVTRFESQAGPFPVACYVPSCD